MGEQADSPNKICVINRYLEDEATSPVQSLEEAARVLGVSEKWLAGQTAAELDSVLKEHAAAKEGIRNMSPAEHVAAVLDTAVERIEKDGTDPTTAGLTALAALTQIREDVGGEVFQELLDRAYSDPERGEARAQILPHAKRSDLLRRTELTESANEILKMTASDHSRPQVGDENPQVWTEFLETLEPWQQRFVNRAFKRTVFYSAAIGLVAGLVVGFLIGS